MSTSAGSVGGWRVYRCRMAQQAASDDGAGPPAERADLPDPPGDRADPPVERADPPQPPTVGVTGSGPVGMSANPSTALEHVWHSGGLRTLRRASLRAGAKALSGAYSLYKIHPALWRLTATHYSPRMGELARLHAWMTCQMANLHVPAYQRHLDEHEFTFRWWDLDAFPTTSKDSYVRRHGEADRCWHGRLRTRGTIVDESSGSSGTPFNWVRGRDELADIHRNVAGFTSLAHRGQGPLFVINAYSMGAWATGTNTGIAMAKIAMVKNTGPDLAKIVDTLEHFGPGFTYLVTAYPPFLKDLRDVLDARGFDWSAYRLHGLVGGEAMTEGLRDYCEQRFASVRSGYGASDLTIGIGGETDLTVWLRKQLLADEELREAVLGPGEARTPMIFQYNPLETYLELSPDDELICTLTSTKVLAPKLRYNIGDEARLLPYDELQRIVGGRAEWAQGAAAASARERMRLPMLFVYGRADATISFMGANIYPQDIENGLYADEGAAASIAAFTLALEDCGPDAGAGATGIHQQPVVHVELREDHDLDETARRRLAASCRDGIIDYLTRVSRDFAQSLEESERSADLRVRLHEPGTGPFADAGGRIKRVYLHPGGTS